MNEELKNLEREEIKGDILSFVPVPCVLPGAVTKAFIKEISFISEEKEQKSGDEYGFDVVRVFSYYKINAVCVNEELNLLGDNFSFIVNKAVGAALINAAKENQSKLFDFIFSYDTKVYEKVENGDIKTIERRFLRVDSYEPRDIYDSRAVEKLIKGGK